ncbi:MAG: DUF1800 domain-containing protein [Herminiimonas sp.]|nr:DUF1800 domain-containing protein [Herminiimonas sp.]
MSHIPVAAAAALSLTACGGGGGSVSGLAAAPPAAPPTAPPTVNLPGVVSDVAASRFLAQASMGTTREEMARVQSLGYAAWIDSQFAMAPSTTRWDWLISKGFDAPANKNSESGFDACAWRKILSSPDTLRQRMTFALSEITVAAIDGLVGSGWKAFSAAAYLDLIEAHAFGNYRTLLGQLSVSAPMGQFLTFRGNVKFNPATGALPDENYAREILQLFSIGLQQLNPDGTPRLVNGGAPETYSLDDITGLARIFTGWDFDLAGKDTSTPDFLRRPMVQIAARHETGASTFLGSTVPAGLNGTDSLNRALDTIFAHPNVAPFISRQLIQKLVVSNPSPAYVSRVASVFQNDGSGIAGNLRAVIKAVLLDVEARQAPSGNAAASYGKLREPIARFSGWARAYGATSLSDAWNVGNTSDPASRLGQSPGRSPSVFNFYRPGYVPPNSPIAAAALVAPEFQLSNESSVVGYVNYMQRAVSLGIGDIKASYTALIPLADNAAALFDEINLVMAAGQISTDNRAMLVGAIGAMPSGSDAARLNRIYAALTLVLAAPEFLIQK